MSNIDYSPSLNESPVGTPSEKMTTRMGAAIESGFEMSELRSLSRWWDKRQAADDGETISPTRAAHDYDINVNEDITTGQAEVIAARKNEERDRNFIINNGNDDLVSKGLIFGSTMLGGVADPIGLALGAVTGIGAGAIVGKSLAAGWKASLAVDIVGNVAGNLFSEVAIVHPVAEEFGEQVSLAMSVATSTLLGIGFPLATRGLKHLFKGLAPMQGSTLDNLLQDTEMSLDAGNTPILNQEAVNRATLGQDAFIDADHVQVRKDANAPELKADYEPPVNRAEAKPEPASERLKEANKRLDDSAISDDNKAILREETKQSAERIKQKEMMEEFTIRCIKRPLWVKILA